jgi:hypothetical protein
MLPVFSGSPTLPTNIIAKPNDFTVYGPSLDLIIGTFDDYGVYWWWKDIEGWFNSSPFTPVVEPRGNSDYGTWARRFARLPKTYTIKGFCYAADKTAAWAARERLMTYWGDPNLVYDLVVDEPTVAKRATVRLNGPVDAPWPESIGRAKGFTFEIPLIAKDALKYSLSPISDQTGTQSPSVYGLTFPITFPLTFSSSGTEELMYATVFNEGNEKSPPTTTLEGAIDAGWRIQNLDDLDDNGQGKILWVNRALSATDRLELDHRDSVARLNGSPVDVDVYGDWFSLVKGQNRIRLSSPTATDAVLTVSGYSAWR